MEKSSISLEETLLPALVQCFGIMFLGYILGRTKILGHREARGLSIFVQYLALPALIFIMISTISFSNVKWEFIASVFVTKACIFMCVALMTILLTNPPDLSKSSLFALASTQSNDFALGYPLLIALYSNTHSEYPAYLYIIAPIQLLILNTIGFFFLEIEKQKHSNETAGKFHFFRILKGTITNPIVFMTVIGMIWNVTYGQKILPILGSILKAFSSAFAATALLLVGHTMAAKSEKSDSHISLTVALLVLTKNLIFPIILQKFSAFMLQNSSDKEIQSLSSFGFLYGTIPTAPSVYVFASQYETCVDVITKTIISSTLISAPVMFATASVISLSQIGIQNMNFYLSQTIGYLSAVNILCCAWLLILFLIGKRWQSISFGATLHLVLAQFVTGIGGFILLFSSEKHTALFYIQYIMSVGGIYATRMCTLLLAVLLLMIRWRSLCFVLRIRNKINVASILLCLILPFTVAAFALFEKNTEGFGPNCQLGFAQNITSFVITTLCLTGTVLCLILQHVCFRKKSTQHQSLNEQVPEFYQTSCEAHQPNLLHTVPTVSEKDPSADISIDVEDIGKTFRNENLLEESESLLPEDFEHTLCDSRYQCSSQRRLQCAAAVSNYVSKQLQKENGLYDNQQIFRQTSLLLALSVAMTLNLSVSFWKLVNENINGIFIELEFLDVIVNYSQGILCFIVFGLDNRLLAVIRQQLRKLWYGSSELNIDELAPTTICQQFRKHYYDRCKTEIGKSIIIDGIEFNNAFSGTDFVEWLIGQGVTDKVHEAEIYGSCLLHGCIIDSIDDVECFSSDKSLFYFSWSGRLSPEVL